MSELIDRLKEGMAEAQKRHAEVTKRWQAAQFEFNVSSAEVNGYAKVIELETRRELAKAAATPATAPDPAPTTEPEPTEVNKTQLIRDALAEHPGLTPAQLYGALKAHLPRRNYVYSVLKRLKDRDQVKEKRGKYYLPAAPKIEEGNENQTTTLQ